jgi:glucose/arabinose dehydrogenase
MKNKFTFCFLLALFLLKINSNAQSISLTPFSVTGVTRPTDIKNCGDNRLFLLDQTGKIRIIDTNGIIRPTPFLNITSIVKSSGNEQGLLGLAFDPDYKNNGYFYLDYTSYTGTGNTHLSRFSVSPTNPDSALASSEQLLLNIWDPYSNHNGGHVFFGPDGYLYAGYGDGGSGGDPENRSQNLDSLWGKMLRLDVSGGGPTYSIPPTNPFVGIPGRDEIWAYGLRNPWRWSFDSWTGDLWIGDVGQNAVEEIDFQPASSHGGENYGWRCYEGNSAYNTSGCQPQSSYVPPVYTNTHSTGNCSITGGYIYRGARYSNLFGKYFFTDYCQDSLRYIQRDSVGAFHQTSVGVFGGGSYTTFGVDRWGEMYAASQNGTVYKLVGLNCSPTAFLSTQDTMYVCGLTSSATLHTPGGNGFHYSWSWSGGIIITDSSSITITQGGDYSVTVVDTSGCSNTSSNLHVEFVNPPTVTASGLDTVYCVFDSPVMLTGNPAGGTFSGSGLTGTDTIYFDPSVAAAGYDTITYVYTDTITGCSNSALLFTRVDLCNGINDQDNIHVLSLYPNPSSGDFNVRVYLSKDEMLNAEITDVIGKTIYSEDVHVQSGSQNIPMNLRHLAKGIYSLKLSEKNGNAVKRFVIE